MNIHIEKLSDFAKSAHFLAQQFRAAEGGESVAQEALDEIMPLRQRLAWKLVGCAVAWNISTQENLQSADECVDLVIDWFLNPIKAEASHG